MQDTGFAGSMLKCEKCGIWYTQSFPHVCFSYAQPQVPLPNQQYESQNDFIGVEPFKTDAVEKAENKGFATIKQKTQLTPLVVVFGKGDIYPGATVWVRGDFCVQPDAKAIYEIEGKQVIFIPFKEVKMVKRW